MQLLDSIREQLSPARSSFVNIIADAGGREVWQTEIRTWAAITYLFIMIILISIHRRLIKWRKYANEQLVLMYDTIRYQVAKGQYEHQTAKENRGIRIIRKASKKTYAANWAAIKQEIIAIEQTTGVQIVSTEQWNKVWSLTRKTKRYAWYTNIIGRLLTLATAGIYKLFR